MYDHNLFCLHQYINENWVDNTYIIHVCEDKILTDIIQLSFILFSTHMWNNSFNNPGHKELLYCIILYAICKHSHAAWPIYCMTLPPLVQEQNFIHHHLSMIKIPTSLKTQSKTFTHKGWILLCQKPWSPINLCVKMHCQNITHMSDHGCVPQIIDACLLHINSYITWLFDIAHWNDISGEPSGQGTMFTSAVFTERVKQYLGFSTKTLKLNGDWMGITSQVRIEN